MCEYHGKHYELYRSHYRGTPDGYFCNGIDLQEPPRNKRYIGYIRVEGRIVLVYRDSRLPYILLFMVSLVAVLVFMYVDTTTYNDYQVSFSQTPLMVEETLYCNVVNVSDIRVEFYFTNGRMSTPHISLAPGECLPSTEMAFTPTHIVYGDYHFKLEVRYD